MEIELGYRSERAILSANSGMVRIETGRGQTAAREASEPIRLIDRTPLSARVRDASGRGFGLRLTERGPELTGDGFAGATLSAPAPA